MENKTREEWAARARTLTVWLAVRRAPGEVRARWREELKMCWLNQL